MMLHIPFIHRRASFDQAIDRTIDPSVDPAKTIAIGAEIEIGIGIGRPGIHPMARESGPCR